MAGHGSWRTAPLPPNWDSEIRPRILARDPQCTWGIIPGEAAPGYLCSDRSTDVDHIIRGGGDHDGNLRGLCHGHHQIKSSGEGGSVAGAERRRMAAQKRRPAQPHPGLRRSA